MNTEQELFPWFAEAHGITEEQSEASEFRQRFRENLRMMRMCWPDWKGPKVCDGIDGRISVRNPIVHNETTGGGGFHYMEPCKIIEIGPRFRWIRAMVDFPEHAQDHCRSKNGQVLKLDFDEIWPPVDDINAQYRITIK
jgi:hypothetical protein